MNSFIKNSNILNEVKHNGGRFLSELKILKDTISDNKFVVIYDYETQWWECCLAIKMSLEVRTYKNSFLNKWRKNLQPAHKVDNMIA